MKDELNWANDRIAGLNRPSTDVRFRITFLSTTIHTQRGGLENDWYTRRHVRRIDATLLC